MRKRRLYTRKTQGMLFNLILLGTIFTSVLLALVQPTSSPTPWWNDDWNFRKQIVLNHTQVVADLANFPVLLDIVDDDLKAKPQFDGDDIVFVDSDNNTLNHEIEFYDSNSGHLVAWIKVPVLSSTEDTEIYVYYGNPSASNQQNSSAVWDSDFVMVQHLEEVSTGRYDSTVNGNNGTAYGGVGKSTSEKIDGSDDFDGVNDNVGIPDSPSLGTKSKVMVEGWFRSSVGLGEVATGWYGGMEKYHAYTLAWNAWSDGWTFQIYAGGARFYVDTVDAYMPLGEWHFIVGQYDGQYLKVFFDGQLKASKNIGSKTIDSNNNAFKIAKGFTGYWKGTIDEVRISNVARSAEWIQTSYNNQRDPAAFGLVREEEVNTVEPMILNENPSNQATEVYTNPELSVSVFHPDGIEMTVIFREKVFNEWKEIGNFSNVANGKYSVFPTDMNKLGTTYYWRVDLTDGNHSTTKIFSFTTTVKILQQKWVAAGVPKGISGVLMADVNGDGVEEVFHAGISGVVCLNGTNGSVIWRISDDGIRDFAQAQMADLNRDGIFEIVIPLENPAGAGLLVLHANNGTSYWRKTGLGREMYSSPVIGDVDGDGYPEVFVASTDVYQGLAGTGRITSLSYDGQILHQTFAWRPCAGGLSLGDTNGDGEFELYMGDRYMYLNSSHYGDNDYGRGVSSYWARNLTFRWSHPDIFSSSQIPMLADVNGDGILDVICGHMSGGVVVLNSTDGSAVKKTLGIPNDAPTHYQPSVYDIDGDGHLELLMADPHDYEGPEGPTPTTSEDLVVWDLVDWKVDAQIYIGKSYYGPKVADVTGDGIMEIIVCNLAGIFILEGGTYRIIDGLTGFSKTLNYAVVQDIDSDGYNEIVVSSRGGKIYAFDTPARKPTPRPRTEVQFYSEYRLGAAEYVRPLTSQEPRIFYTNPSNLATDVSLSLSELQFTLTDYQYDLMNYTVTTNPYVGSSTGISVRNGMHTLSISNLAPSTTYTWAINVTDGTHWTNKTYIFRTGNILPWWNSKWQYRKEIRIDHNKVVADLEGFPILIDIMDNDLPTKARSDGFDIVFADNNGIKLNHEIELYDNNTGHLVAWVSVSNLSSESDTRLYMYYGNPSAPDQQNPSAVWDSDFVMVQHLEEASAIRYDSTIEGNNGTAYGGVGKSTSEKIDGSDDLDGKNDYVGILDSSSLDIASQVTVEGWFRSSRGLEEVLTGWFGGVGKSSAYSLAWNAWSDGWTFQIYQGGVRSYCDTIDAYMPKGEWHYVMGQYDGQYLKVFIDGQLKASKNIGSKTVDSNSAAFDIGRVFGYYWNGSIDEVRISNVARSAEWIQTSYNNQKNPSTFYTVRSEETVPWAPIVFLPSPTDSALNVSPTLSELSFNITDAQDDLMNYTVTTNPYIGSESRLNVSNGRYTLIVNNLQYSTTYKWTVSVTDGMNQTDVTFRFTTLPSEPPTQDDPILLTSQGGNITCYNQTTYDSDGDKVTNIYNWYKNGASTTNLLLPFDTNNTVIAKDYSGYNNNGIIVRGATWTSNGRVGGAYKFEGGFIEIPGTNSLDGGGQWSEITLEHWIYLTASQSGTRTISRIPSYEIGIDGNKIFAGIWVDTGSSMISGYNRITYETPLQINRWYHVALTYKSNVGLTLYIDGTAVATTLVSGNIQRSGLERALYISWFDYFKGLIDEVRTYPKSLSPQQIYQRYIETKDGLSNSSTIVFQETEIDEVWKCKVTPNDVYQDGIAKFSNSTTIGFVDTFDDNSANLAIWKKLEKNNGTVSETNGRVEISVETAPPSGTAGYITIKSYDLSNSDIRIDVSNQYLCEAALAITLDGIDDHFWYSDNFYAIEKHRYSETCKVKKRVDGGDWIYLYDGNWTGPTGSLRIRIHEGIIYFYEEDNLRYSEQFGLSSYNLYIHFEANTWGDGYFGTDYFDNFMLLLGPP